MNYKLIFHYLSYFQYPVMLVALYFIFQPYFNGFKNILENINIALIFLGIGVSLSTLQDTTKVQNRISRKVWEDPRKGKFFLVYLSFITLSVLVIGVIGYFGADNTKLKEVSFGLIVFGIGLIGMLKSALEMFENHRPDKKTE